MLDDRTNDRSLTVPTTPVSRSLSKSSPRALTVRPPPLRERARNQTEDDISVQPHSQADDQSVEPDDPFFIPVPAAAPSEPWQCPKSKLDDLPLEILEGIIGHVVGHLGSTISDSSDSLHTMRNWNAVMRHPRRKKVADLALVSSNWRKLIQERVYRHIKIQGTKLALEECGDWFFRNPHLQAYVRHFEVLVPIWEMKTTPKRPRSGLINPNWTGERPEGAAAFQLASKNATIEDIFSCTQGLFPLLCALTIEGGHCKRPPKIKYFRQVQRIEPSTSHHRFDTKFDRSMCTNATLSLLDCVLEPAIEVRVRQRRNTQPSSSNKPPQILSLAPPKQHIRFAQLPTLPGTKTLILKGAWNLIRSPSDFSVLSSALPSLREFHCTYHKPKTGAYIAMCDTLQQGFPPTITHLNLCLEGLYTKNASSLKKWRKLYPSYHVCRNLGAIAPQLESLTYTGRVCSKLFSSAIQAGDQMRTGCTRLRTIDIVVNNVCREHGAHNDGTGIHNWPFIQAFELLVLKAVRSLQAYIKITNMRIRFIDLDSPAPLLNPMFHLEGGRAWGLWNEEILGALREARPQVRFGVSSNALVDEEAELLDRHMAVSGLGRYRCMTSDYYRAMAHGGGIW